MAISVTCPQCAHQLKVPEKFAGRKGRCPKCQAVFVASSEPAAAPSPAPRPAAPAGGKPPVPRPASKPALPQSPELPAATEVETVGGLPDFGAAPSPSSRVTSRKNRTGSRKKNQSGAVPVWVWATVGVGGGALVLLMIVLIVTLVGRGSPEGSGSSVASNANLGGATSSVVLQPPMPLDQLESYEGSWGGLLDQATTNCQKFDFTPANDSHYAWMQRFAILFSLFAGNDTEFLESPEQAEQISIAVANAKKVLNSLEFTPERIAAVNQFGARQASNPDMPVAGVFMYCRLPEASAGVSSGSSSRVPLVLENSKQLVVVRCFGELPAGITSDQLWIVIGVIEEGRTTQIETSPGSNSEVPQVEGPLTWIEGQANPVYLSR